jgi:hypothetical protein
VRHLPSVRASLPSGETGNLGPKLGPTGGIFQPTMVRKLRQINESLIGYEPEGREFESLRSTILSHSFRFFLSSQELGRSGTRRHHRPVIVLAFEYF